MNKEHFIGRFERAVQGSLPGVGTVYSVTFEHDELAALLEILRAPPAEEVTLGTGPIHRVTYALEDIKRWEVEAARYRWLRDKSHMVEDSPIMLDVDGDRFADDPNSDSIDSVIDIAMRSPMNPQPPEQGEGK